jgi:saccharopine dehydrogenase (NADP+, L-glutamate forming)
VLLEIFLKKWEMKPEDKDLVVMQHEVEYQYRDRKNKLTSTMVIKGENREMSAMAKTVGLPMAILGKHILLNKIPPIYGVHIPNMPYVYRAVLHELRNYGIDFHEVVE